jgi:hypothetical protein
MFGAMHTRPALLLAALAGFRFIDASRARLPIEDARFAPH